MTTRLPQKRYIGDGVYATHDGYQIILETSDGIQATNRIGLDDDTLEGIQKYRPERGKPQASMTGDDLQITPWQSRNSPAGAEPRG